MLRRLTLLATLACALLAGCDLLGIDSLEKVAAVRDADGRAIGGACRQVGRAIEDCYALNRKADRAAIFAGWREMNDYMRENKLDAATPQVAPPAPKAEAADDAASAARPAPRAAKPARHET